MKKYYHRISIKGIAIILVGGPNGLSQLLVNNEIQEFEIVDDWIADETYFLDAEKQLIEYFDGKRMSFDIKLDLQGTEFQHQVWDALCHIPYGDLCSYKNIAEYIGNPKASRAVGSANNRNPIPIIIPCHRVVGANKKLMGYVYGLALKKQLILLEKGDRLF